MKTIKQKFMKALEKIKAAVKKVAKAAMELNNKVVSSPWFDFITDWTGVAFLVSLVAWAMTGAGGAYVLTYAVMVFIKMVMHIIAHLSKMSSTTEWVDILTEFVPNYDNPAESYTVA